MDSQKHSWKDSSYGHSQQKGYNSQNLDINTRFGSGRSNRWVDEHKQFEQTFFAPVEQKSSRLSVKSQNVHRSPQVSPQTVIPDKGGLIHFVAGGAAGCAATLVTCPIDVIKTRQQSSICATATSAKVNLMARTPKPFTAPIGNQLRGAHYVGVTHGSATHSTILHHCRYILKVEGARSFYKGLAPSLMGVVPSRAIYFYAYSGAKGYLQSNQGMRADSTLTHVVAATAGSFACTTATCPLWVVKTQQQLHRRLNNVSLSVFECCRRIWSTEGWRGFYRGLSASYAGIFETVIYFAIYERLKVNYLQQKNIDPNGLSVMSSFWELPGLMLLSSASKISATVLAYPHEVVRTRLREEAIQKKYSGFWQTVREVRLKEGSRALYAGMPAQLVRQVPNMAILMGVYEAIIYATR
uniref:Solute carrier family 25 member 36 n=1 Tax=Phallusia mammillata TaxID=59560 RepID=A0A6F9DT40_9ASCI|nr:solute carrier family 25 member 36 [Phallusia mammillata]